MACVNILLLAQMMTIGAGEKDISFANMTALACVSGQMLGASMEIHSNYTYSWESDTCAKHNLLSDSIPV